MSKNFGATSFGVRPSLLDARRPWEEPHTFFYGFNAVSWQPSFPLPLLPPWVLPPGRALFDHFGVVQV